MIGTGGTIASEESPDGLAPKLDPQQLLAFVPGIERLCRIECAQPFHLDSSNIRPVQWLALKQCLQENYEKYDGFVICHGTDTMAYTAAALTYLVQGAKKPIVLTGAQRPIWVDSTDSKQNLQDAFIYACEGGGGVQIVFNGKVIAGARARKTFSKSFHAFSSVNYPDLAAVRDGRVTQYIRIPSMDSCKFADTINANVGLLKLIPGVDAEVTRFMLHKYDGLVIEGFGVGGLPEYNDLYDAVRCGVEQGKIIVMSTQVPNEGSDLAVYHVGGRLKNTLRLLEAYDMTTEAAVTKLMWILGRTREFEEAAKLFYAPVTFDILHPCGPENTGGQVE